MRNFVLFSAFALSTVCLAGCHSSAPSAAGGVNQPNSDRSLADMETEYAKMREKNLSDCLYGGPEKIKANQALCQKEREQMAPLGNEIEAAEIKAARRATKP